MKQFLKGAIFATIGITFLNTFSEITVNLGQLINAKLAVKIQECNIKIKDLENPPINNIRAIGFTTEDIRTEENDYE